MVAEQLVDISPSDDRNAQEQWQVHPPDPYYGQRMHPLKAFSQTCRLFADIALPMLWKNVSLKLEVDFSGLERLLQLLIALEDEHIVRLVQSITINGRRDESELEQYCIGGLRADWFDAMSCSDRFPDVDAFEALLVRLGERLPSTNLVRACSPALCMPQR